MSGVLYFLAFIIQILCSNASPSVTKCKLSDSECLTSSAIQYQPQLVQGIPELNIDPIDPMHIKEIKVELSGLQLDLKDVSLTGFKDANIHKLSIDEAKKQMKLVLSSNFLLKGKYKASGQLLILPISGDGDASFDITNERLEMTFHLDTVKNSHGQEVLGLKSFSYDYDIIDGMKVRLTNLFNGNKVLSDTLHKFMDDNWKQLSLEFGRPLLDSVNKILFKNIKKYLKSQPLKDITLP